MMTLGVPHSSGPRTHKVFELCGARRAAARLREASLVATQGATRALRPGRTPLHCSWGVCGGGSRSQCATRHAVFGMHQCCRSPAHTEEVIRGTVSSPHVVILPTTSLVIAVQSDHLLCSTRGCFPTGGAALVITGPAVMRARLSGRRISFGSTAPCGVSRSQKVVTVTEFEVDNRFRVWVQFVNQRYSHTPVCILGALHVHAGTCGTPWRIRVAVLLLLRLRCGRTVKICVNETNLRTLRLRVKPPSKCLTTRVHLPSAIPRDQVWVCCHRVPSTFSIHP
mmetsp:Transcript_2676/g.8010  ORF Transcript_2676/g.8010 Transcript_2676/m.8010 type:complete len:281 (-) Transcript_2676:50-892(-)